MKIGEAVKLSMARNRCITLPEFEGILKIKPTDGPENCVVMRTDSSHPSKHGWQPSAKDLIREDWVVTE